MTIKMDGWIDRQMDRWTDDLPFIPGHKGDFISSGPHEDPVLRRAHTWRNALKAAF